MQGFCTLTYAQPSRGLLALEMPERQDWSKPPSRTTDCNKTSVLKPQHSVVFSKEKREPVCLQVHNHGGAHDHEEPAQRGVEVEDAEENGKGGRRVGPVQPVSVNLVIFFHKRATLRIHPQVLVGSRINDHLSSCILVGWLVFCRKLVVNRSWSRCRDHRYFLCPWCWDKSSWCSSGSQAKIKATEADTAKGRASWRQGALSPVGLPRLTVWLGLHMPNLSSF